MTSIGETARAPNRTYVWLGALLTVAGLCGHLFAARAIGGYYLAWRDHIAGFTLALIITGLLIAALGSRFWKRRTDLTVLIIGLVQAAIGLLVYIRRFQI